MTQVSDSDWRPLRQMEQSLRAAAAAVQAKDSGRSKVQEARSLARNRPHRVVLGARLAKETRGAKHRLVDPVDMRSISCLGQMRAAERVFSDPPSVSASVPTATHHWKTQVWDGVLVR